MDCPTEEAVIRSKLTGMAILADMGVSLIVIFNGLRLLRAEAPFSPGPEIAELRPVNALLEVGRQ
jgi:hypothetical protein